MKKTVATETVCSSKVPFWYKKGQHLKSKKNVFSKFSLKAMDIFIRPFTVMGF